LSHSNPHPRLGVLRGRRHAENNGSFLVRVWIIELNLEIDVAGILEILVNNDDADVLGLYVLDAPDCKGRLRNGVESRSTIRYVERRTTFRAYGAIQKRDEDMC
jgi:hypothetical protein